MKKHRLKTVALTAVLAVGAAGGPAVASQLDTILSTANEVHDQARRSQVRIDQLSDEARRLLQDYRTVLKEIEGLRVYNRQLDRQIAAQEREKTELNESIETVTLIERQIMPLMVRMIDGLEQFVSLDVPFLLSEREARVERVRDLLDRADIEVAEQFGQILNAYQIENEYGRTMEAYTDEIELDGRTLVVDFLRMGRVSLMYQTADGARSGVWNQRDRSWQELPASYTTPIRNGIRMARQQMAVDLVSLPIPGPVEASQ
ncbi:MAG: DUF3450 domain-containing protein [Gammaproteobacteria bacterium]|jgi:hypothetical protein|nr:DUF3450 domain-containing protein [Gammaproteobacteria bacterium]